MPYSGPSDPKMPDYIKKLSKKARTAWVKAFNAAYHSFDPAKHKAANAEAYAFAVANSVVKKMKGKHKESLAFFPKGTKFVTAREVALYDSILEEIEVNENASEKNTEQGEALMNTNEFNIGDKLVTSLKEAKIDDASGTAEIIALQAGWSSNGKYYSKEVVESLPKFLLERSKIYLNHVDTAEKKLGRNLRDWVATVEEAYGKDGKAFAKIRFTGNADASWLLQEALRHPEQLHFSIDAIGRGHEGEAEGKSGIVIESFVFLDSLDVVDYGAAGGRLVAAYASQAASEVNLLYEAAATLRDKVEKRVTKDRLEILFNVFIGMLHELSWTCEFSDDEKKERIGELVDEFLDEFENIDIVKAFESFMANKEVKMDLSELKEKYPEVFEQVKSEILNTDEVKAKDAAISSLEAKISDITASVEAVTSEKKKLEDALTTVQAEVDKYKAEELRIAKEGKINEMLKSTSLGTLDSIPVYVKNELLSKTTDDDIKTFIEALSSIIDRVSTVVVDSGKTAPVTKLDETVVKSLAKDNDAAAQVFKGK